MKLYLIRNKEGKFFRAIGYGGSGPSWVEIDKAKFYSKIGQAKSRVTFFTKNYPQYGVPDILEFEVNPAAAVVIDMKAETIKKIEKAWLKENKKINKLVEQRRVKSDSYSLDLYQREINRLNKVLKVLLENA